MKKSLLFICLLFTISVSQASIFRPGKDFALFFANDDYSNNPQFNNLKNPLKDAQAIEQELKEMFGFKTYMYANYTKSQIYETLEDWQSRSFVDDAQLFVFFSGHGSFSEFESKGYFVPNGDQSNFGSYIDLTSLGNIITKIPCNHILLAIDACYSGTIDEKIAFKGHDDVNRSKAREREIDRIITSQLRNKSRLLITSGGKQRTPDGTDHSPFSAALLSGLRSSYTNGDNLFLWPDLLRQMERVSPTPHKGSLRGHENGGFVFVAQSPNSQRANSTVDKSLPSDQTINSGSNIRDKNGNTYAIKTMKDGNRWITKNLNVKIKGSTCYQKKTTNCDVYGRLYNWEAAKKACAKLGEEWRLPTDQEWRKLALAYGGYYGGLESGQKGIPTFSYKSLMENGSSEFNAQQGGLGGRHNFFWGIYEDGYYWTATEKYPLNAYSITFLGISQTLHIGNDYKDRMLSVRCIRKPE